MKLRKYEALDYAVFLPSVIPYSQLQISPSASACQSPTMCDFSVGGWTKFHPHTTYNKSVEKPSLVVAFVR